MSDQRLIRKYVNRRLYDTSQSRYVNLEDLREMVARGGTLRVVEQATGADITTTVLLQIIAEGQKSGRALLSPEFLSGLIRLASAEHHDDDLPVRLDRALRSVLSPTPARSSVPGGLSAMPLTTAAGSTLG